MAAAPGDGTRAMTPFLRRRPHIRRGWNQSSPCV